MLLEHDGKRPRIDPSAYETLGEIEAEAVVPDATDGNGVTDGR